MAFFKTSRAESNEVAKAEDITFNFDSQVSNFSVLLQSLIDTSCDFVVGGKVYALSGMNLGIEPILGCSKDSGICFASTEHIEEGIAVSAAESQARIDIVQVKALEEEYDEQQRSFIDFETKIETIQNVFTKKRVILQVEVKKGVAGSATAPVTDTGYVKLAEIYVPENTTTIDDWYIYNITANYQGEKNTDWTNEKDRTYDLMRTSDVNAQIQNEHNKDGTHKNKIIGSSELDTGIGENQVNNSVIPLGSSITVDNNQYAATTQTSAFLRILAEKISNIIADYYNKGGKYNFNGEFLISDVFENNTLTKALKIKSDGNGVAYFYVGTRLVFSITENGNFQMPNGYTATATNHIVTKAITDEISTQISGINTIIDGIKKTLSANQEFVNQVYSRYSFSDQEITVATTQNIELYGEQTIDGVAVVINNIVLVKNQTDATKNGIYTVQSGNWNRHTNFTNFSSIKYKFFTILNGISNVGKVFYSPQETCELGTDNLNFEESFFNLTEKSHTVPVRDANGNLKTGTPMGQNDSTPKKYVDDAETRAKNLANATGALALAKGGTGKTTTKAAQNALLADMKTEESTPGDDSLLVMKYTTSSDTNGAVYARKASYVWEWIKTKISSVLGLTSTSYSGNSASATKATNDSKSQAITSYIRDLSVSGKVITYTKGNGTTGTLTTQDTNTTYSNATSTTAGLMSASDKTKLDGLKSTSIIYPSSISLSSAVSLSKNISITDSTAVSTAYSVTSTSRTITNNSSGPLSIFDITGLNSQAVSGVIVPGLLYGIPCTTNGNVGSYSTEGKVYLIPPGESRSFSVSNANRHIAVFRN